ncbi:MAG: flavodoxin domain-containing protein [Candidatus Bathyarchaeota archaeon]|nr:flavodoxin domain-containing protein [Candidatus Bathyarchaeota archaeon]
MNACVVYFSRTGNTKKFAQAIADATKAPLYDLNSAATSTLENCDLLIFGTPVEGASPTKEALTYIENMPTVSGKKAILFCTYRLFGNQRAMKTVEKALSARGYETILKVSKKGMKPEQQQVDFSKELAQVKKALETVT